MHVKVLLGAAFMHRKCHKEPAKGTKCPGPVLDIEWATLQSALHSLMGGYFILQSNFHLSPAQRQTGHGESGGFTTLLYIY